MAIASYVKHFCYVIFVIIAVYAHSFDLVFGAQGPGLHINGENRNKMG